MILRRIRQHVTAHNWFAVSIDLVIVVAGVFLGMQVNSWNEDRNEAQQGRDYRARLIGELDFNARQYRQQVAYYQQVQAHGLALLEALRQPGQPRGTEFLVDAYQTTQLDPTPAKRYIYDEMMSAGLVSRLGDFRIQELASDYYLSVTGIDRTVFETPPFRDIVRRAMPYPIQKQISERCGDRLVTSKGRVVGIGLQEKCELSISPAMLAEGVSRISEQPGLELDLNRCLAALAVKLSLLQFNQKLTEELLAELQKVHG
jgi:hypothetical protein